MLYFHFDFGSVSGYNNSVAKTVQYYGGTFKMA